LSITNEAGNQPRDIEHGVDVREDFLPQWQGRTGEADRCSYLSATSGSTLIARRAGR
jgi:hypothetical protein